MDHHPLRALVVAAVAAALSLPVAACLDREVSSVEPHTQTQIVETIHQSGALKVDLLFVIDNSGSMESEQLELGRRVEDMVRELVQPTPNPAGETPPPLDDLHVAVISTDMGSGGYLVGSCEDSPTVGDDGVLRTESIDPGCPELADPFITYDGTGDPAEVARDLACVAHLGVSGCGMEQPLEAMLVALTTQSDPGRPNEGFLRDDSILGVVIVTDEDDCSAASPTIFDNSGTAMERYGRDLNLRCTRYPDLLQPIDRYAAALRRLRPDPDRLVVAAIVGVPEDWDSRLESLRDLVVEDGSFNGGLHPSCVTDEENPHAEYATSPVRIAELVAEFGQSGVIHSICQDDWRPALTAITRKLQERFTGRCLSRRLPLPADPEVCRVVETLTDDRTCAASASTGGADRSEGFRLDLGVEVGHRTCQVLPADYDADGTPDPGLDGWYYVRHEEGASCPGEVLFTEAAIPEPGSNVRIECLTSLCPARRRCRAVVGMPCDPDAADCGADEVCVPGPGGALCVPAVRTVCGGAPAQWLDEAVVFDGCCHTGFHCEDDGGGAEVCLPNRTTACGS